MNKKNTKEKLIEEIRVMVQPTLYKTFKEACKKEYKTISEVIRNFMVDFSRKSKNK
jgi:DNA-binding phage protein